MNYRIRFSRRRRPKVNRRRKPFVGAPPEYVRWNGQKTPKPASAPRQPKGGDA